ncbi:MAG: hypothetical protein H7Z14_17240 [Anaerolineae bacterium]|nr:hypothetical protein [Phycisphaerae bacterium]
MTEATTAIRWRARRTTTALWVPTLCAIAAMSTPAYLDPVRGMVITMLCGITAMLLELTIRRQLSLATHGREVQAIVDEVHPQGLRYDNAWVKFHFIADSGAMVDGKCPINDIDVLVLATGSRVEVLYDPANPKRHILVDKLWAIRWERDE